MLFKGTAKYTFIGKSGIVADILDRECRVFQEIFGCIQSDVDQVSVGCETGFFREYTYKVI